MKPTSLTSLGLKIWLVTCMFFGFFKSTNANAGTIDSLKIAFDLSENPHEKVLLQIEVANQYYNKRSTDTAIFEYRKAISLIPSDSLELKGKTLERLSFAYRQKEDMDNMLMTQLVTNDLFEKANANPYLKARSFQLTGRAYYEMGKYDSAMVYYMSAKGLYEQHDIVHTDRGYLLHFIGSVYKRQGNFEKACEYYDEEVQYGKDNGMKTVEVEGMYLRGICIDDIEERLINDQECLRIYKELGNYRSVGLMYSLIAEDFLELDRPDSAFYYYDLCIEVYEQTGEISLMGAVLSEISRALIEEGRYAEAEKNLQKAHEIALKTGIKQHIRYWTLYESYFNLKMAQGKYKEAVEYQTLMYTYRDSAKDQDHQHSILSIEKEYNQEKQQVEYEKNLAIEKEAAKRAQESEESQAFITRITMFGGVVILALMVFVFIKYKESVKQKKIILEQQKETQFQKDIIEAKNQDIVDSMVYASSIQRAIITSDEYIQKMFTDFFAFYKPRDIVSGDFYWAFEGDDGKKYMAVGDCTGHGVPGAMMSMLGSAFLNEIVVEGKQTGPANILNKLRAQIKRALNEEGKRDGMDMAFCQFENGKVTFAGAHLPLYILREGVLTELKGDKQPVGFINSEEVPFTEQTFQLEPNDVIYMFSDGYSDQFGGSKGKKYKRQTFRDKLSHVSSLAFTQQLKVIEEEFETWKGDLEQLDDVCVIGLRV